MGRMEEEIATSANNNYKSQYLFCLYLFDLLMLPWAHACKGRGEEEKKQHFLYEVSCPNKKHINF